MPPKKSILSLKKHFKPIESDANLSKDQLKSKLRKLKKQKSALEKEITALKAEGVTNDLRPEVEALHEYNEIKDITQMVLGCLSDTEGVVLSELYERYELPLE